MDDFLDSLDALTVIIANGRGKQHIQESERILGELEIRCIEANIPKEVYDEKLDKLHKILEEKRTII